MHSEQTYACLFPTTIFFFPVPSVRKTSALFGCFPYTAALKWFSSAVQQQDQKFAIGFANFRLLCKDQPVYAV